MACTSSGQPIFFQRIPSPARVIFFVFSCNGLQMAGSNTFAISRLILESASYLKMRSNDFRVIRIIGRIMYY